MIGVGADSGATSAAPGKAVTRDYSANISAGSPIIEGGDDRDGALALTLRLMGRGFGFLGDDTPTRLLVGRLPDPSPIPIPLPDGARVVGSQILGSVATIVLDVDLSEDAALAFYRERLEADGWTPPAQQPGIHGGGFAPTWRGPALVYCCGTRGPSLSVQATAVEGGPTDVRLNVNTDPCQSPCAPQPHHGDWRDPLPTLAPQAGARQMPQDGGGGSNGYYSQATVRTDLDPATLGAHDAAQLRDAGWTAQGEGHAGPVAWSAWSFRDRDGEEGEEWRGLLFALRRPEVDGDYVVYLRADAREGDAASGGWTSSTVSATRTGG